MTTATATKPKIAFNITISRDDLLTTVSRVRGVVERRSTTPILKNLRLAAVKDRLEITGTDLDVQISASVAAPGGDGQTTVEAEQLGGLLAKMPSGGECSLSLGGDDPRLILKCGRSTYRLPVLPPGDYPTMSEDNLGPPIKIDTSTFADLLGKVGYAQAVEEQRIYLNGIYFHVIEVDGRQLLRLVATNGHQLALAEMDAPKGFEGIKPVIIPRKTVRELVRVLEAAGEEIVIRTAQGKFRVEAGSSILTSKVIDGDYPPYQRVIPADNPHTVTLDRKILAGAVERAMVLIAERSSPLRLDFEPGGLSILARTIESGEGVEKVEADYDGPPLTVGFNGRYLMEVLARIEAEKVEFRLGASDPGSQIVRTPALIIDPDNARARFVLVPLRA